MRVLVAGGAGYIGSHACKALAAAGHEPVVFDDLSTGHRWAVRWGPLVEGDLGDTALVRRVLAEQRIAAVMHFAASIAVGESVEDPAKYFRNNVVNTLNLLDAMRAEGVGMLVFSSTAAVYGTPRETPITEEHPLEPINPYGDTKLMMEKALKWYGNAYGLHWRALRYFNAAGADPDGDVGEQHNPETHLIPLILEAADGRRDAINVYGTDYPTPDGTAVRDYIHVADLADAHVSALQHLADGHPGGALNLGTGVGHSVAEVIETVKRVTGRDFPVRNTDRRAGDPPALVADPARANAALDWRATRSDLETIVATAWRWARQGSAREEKPA